jgi:hypothetical protein
MQGELTATEWDECREWLTAVKRFISAIKKSGGVHPH